MASGVYVASIDIEALMVDLDAWFNQREDVNLIGKGVSRAGDHFVVIRFGGRVDALFPVLLEKTDYTVDYAVFEIVEPEEEAVSIGDLPEEVKNAD